MTPALEILKTRLAWWEAAKIDDGLPVDTRLLRQLIVKAEATERAQHDRLARIRDGRCPESA